MSKFLPEHIERARKEIVAEMTDHGWGEGAYLKIRDSQYGDRWLVVRSLFGLVIGEPLLDGWMCYYFDGDVFQYCTPHSFQAAAPSIRNLIAVF